MKEEVYFKARCIPHVRLYFHGIIFLLIYFGSSIYVYKLVEPYKEALGNLLHARGVLLESIIAFPFLVVIFTISYFIYGFLIFKKRQIRCGIKNHKMCFDIEERKFELDKNDLKKTIFFVDKQNNTSRLQVIKQKSAESFILIGHKDDHYFQQFIRFYENYLNIKIQNLEPIDSSSVSVLIKKVYCHLN